MTPPRYAPEFELPPYTYVPGGPYPHPISDPAGHSFKQRPQSAAPDPEKWRDCRHYLHGIDLFNHGYYWEAHEAWESLWHACGRAGTTATFLKGLIKFAAAGVKWREGVSEGIRNHMRRAAELLREVQAVSGNTLFMGLELTHIIDVCTTEQIETLRLLPC